MLYSEHKNREKRLDSSEQDMEDVFANTEIKKEVDAFLGKGFPFIGCADVLLTGRFGFWLMSGPSLFFKIDLRLQ